MVSGCESGRGSSPSLRHSCSLRPRVHNSYFLLRVNCHAIGMKIEERTFRFYVFWSSHQSQSSLNLFLAAGHISFWTFSGPGDTGGLPAAPSASRLSLCLWLFIVAHPVINAALHRRTIYDLMNIVFVIYICCCPVIFCLSSSHSHARVLTSLLLRNAVFSSSSSCVTQPARLLSESSTLTLTCGTLAARVRGKSQVHCGKGLQTWRHVVMS